MYKYFTILILAILLMPTPSFSDEYSSIIDSAIKRLGATDYRTRKLAMQELVALPIEANEALEKKFENATNAVKIMFIEIFAMRQQVETCSKIIEMIEFLPESASFRIASALDKIGDIGWKTLIKSIEDKSKQGITRSPKLEKVYMLLVRERIINFYADRVESRRFAYYTEEYTEIFKFGKITLEVLSDLIFNKNNILSNFPADKTDKIRDYAVRSLGDSGLPEAKNIISKAMNKFKKRQYYWMDDDVNFQIDFLTVCKLALFNLGDTKTANDLITKSLQDMKTIRDNAIKIDFKFYLANLYLITHKLDEAEKIYNEVLDSFDSEQNGTALKRKKSYAYYKLAVITGIRAILEKDTEKKDSLRRLCMQNLKKAVREGFNDFNRIFLDKNIAILWDTSEFTKWIEKLKTDEKFKDIIPKWEAGKPTKLTKEEIDKTPESGSFEPFPE